MSLTDTSITSTIGDMSLHSSGQISINYNMCYLDIDNRSNVESIEEQDEDIFDNDGDIYKKTATAIMNIPVSSPSSDAFRYFVEVIENTQIK